MIVLAVNLPDDDGSVSFLLSTIGGAITNRTQKKHTDVYTDTFPQGVTIDMMFKDFYMMWQQALLLQAREEEIIFTATDEPAEEEDPTCH